MTEQDVKDINSVIQLTLTPEIGYAELTLIISNGVIKHKNLQYEIGKKKPNTQGRSNE